MKRGLILAGLHLAIVFTLVAKYAWDRETLPRAWSLTANFDPNLPVRGRYVSLRLGVVAPFTRVRFLASKGQLIAVPDGGGVVNEPIAFFLPEHVADPSRLKPGEVLWVEVSVPKKGMPRPIRLAVKRNGQLTPLELR